MPFNGGGTFVRETPVATGAIAWADTVVAGDTTISTNDHDFHDQDIAAGLSGCVTRNGQSPATANLPMGNFHHTGVSNATARNQYLAAGQLQDGGVMFATTSGSSGTYTATLSPAITAYVDGAEYHIRFTAACGANVPTLNLNGVGALSIYAPNSQALGGGSITALSDMTLRYSAALPGLVVVMPNVPVLLEAGNSASSAALQILRNLTGFSRFQLKLTAFNLASGVNGLIELTIKAGGSFLASGYSGATLYGDLNTITPTWAVTGISAYHPLGADNFFSANTWFDIEIVPPTTIKNYTTITSKGAPSNTHGQTLNEVWGMQSGTGVVQGLQILGSAATFYKYEYELWGIP